MNRTIGRSLFYTHLFASRFGLRNTRFVDVSPVLDQDTNYPRRLSIHFWTPQDTAGAKVIVHDVVDTIRRECRHLGLDWEISVGNEEYPNPVDHLVCFKAIPKFQNLAKETTTTLLICDQLESFWPHIKKFDRIVATASRPLASVLASGAHDVSYISESEPDRYLSAGEKNLRTPPSQRQPILMWHGGGSSLRPLLKLKPSLEELAEEHGSPLKELHIISGREPESDEKWGSLTVRRFPWSEANLISTASVARLGFAPARQGLRVSWLKPASRVRCMQALGVPSIGDLRVPDVREFMSNFSGPVVAKRSEWISQIRYLISTPDEVDRLASEGYKQVADNHNASANARKWVNFLATDSNATT